MFGEQENNLHLAVLGLGPHHSQVLGGQGGKDWEKGDKKEMMTVREPGEQWRGLRLRKIKELSFEWKER